MRRETSSPIEENDVIKFFCEFWKLCKLVLSADLAELNRVSINLEALSPKSQHRILEKLNQLEQIEFAHLQEIQEAEAQLREIMLFVKSKMNSPHFQQIIKLYDDFILIFDHIAQHRKNKLKTKDVIGITSHADVLEIAQRLVELKTKCEQQQNELRHRTSYKSLTIFLDHRKIEKQVNDMKKANNEKVLREAYRKLTLFQRETGWHLVARKKQDVTSEESSHGFEVL